MKKSLYLFLFPFFCFLFSNHLIAQNYCDAAGAPGTTSDYITRVQLYSINNGSEQTGYSDFTNLSTDLVQGADYSLRIFIGFTFDLDTAHAWIDFNQNYEFEDTEKISMSPYVDDISTGTVSVPANAVLGETRMRVRNIYSADVINDPCNDYFGEVEDYSVNIIEATCAEVGNPCDDGHDCTMNDTIDANCNCVGDFEDDDYDGVCNEEDQCPGLDDSIDLDNNGIPDLCEDYCMAEGANGTGADWINRVRLYTLNNPSQKTSFSDFTDLNVELVQGANYELAIHLNTVFNEDLAHAWIDFNQDFIFQPDEEINMSLFSFTDNSSTGTVSVPPDAPLGTTRMRVRNIWSVDPVDFPACGNYFGEVEDYSVTIIEATCTMVGEPCDDGLDCSTNDVIDANCNCFGEIIDDDFDGVCNEDDICPGEDDLLDLDSNGILDCLDYCLAAGLDGTGEDFISNVIIDEVEYPSGQTFYSDFTDSIIVVERGQELDISVHLNDVFAEDEAHVWVDFNQNMEFEADEKMLTLPYDDTISYGIIDVPVDAPFGATRMRVRNIWNDISDPCNDYFGEVEDYTVLVEDMTNTGNVIINKINIFPNPASDFFILNTSQHLIGNRIAVCDLNGRIVTSFEIINIRQQFSVAGLASGIYFIKMNDKSSDEFIAEKLIVE